MRTRTSGTGRAISATYVAAATPSPGIRTDAPVDGTVLPVLG